MKVYINEAVGKRCNYLFEIYKNISSSLAATCNYNIKSVTGSHWRKAVTEVVFDPSADYAPIQVRQLCSPMNTNLLLMMMNKIDDALHYPLFDTSTK